MRRRFIAKFVGSLLSQAGEGSAWYHPARDPAGIFLQGDEAIKWCHI
jgi:hypothetical protein